MPDHFKNSEYPHKPQNTDQFPCLANYLIVLKFFQQQSKIKWSYRDKIHKVLWIRYESRYLDLVSVTCYIDRTLPVFVRTKAESHNELSCEEDDAANIHQSEYLHDDSLVF